MRKQVESSAGALLIRIGARGTRQQSPSMVATSTDKCRPLRHFTEHVAGSDVGKVERRFGLLLG